MAPVNRLDAMRASVASLPHHDHEHHEPNDEAFELNDFEEEMKRLSAVNQELMHQHQPDGQSRHVAVEDSPPSAPDELSRLRLENAKLKACIEELETLGSAQDEDHWLEKMREYEMLLEEKSEVIRSLHQKIHEIQESALVGDSGSGSSPNVSGVGLGQAEEILRLKREMEEQRRQLEQDEKDMMGQMRQMEITMAKERAEMARQRQEVQRLQAELTREIENSSRDPELRERLHNLRRAQEPKQAPLPTPIPGGPPTPRKEQPSSGLLRRLFG